jgi:hypothetical protein
MSILKILAKYIGLPLAEKVLGMIVGAFKKWFQKKKDKEDVEKTKEAKKAKLAKVNEAKDNNDKPGYIDNITGI